MGYYTSVTFAEPATLLRFDFPGDEPLVFRRPLKVIRTGVLGDVIAALEAAERSAQQGFYVAGYVAYEAAPAFDAALSAHPPTGDPLVWFGVFEQPEAVPATPAPAPNIGGWTLQTPEADYRRAVETIRENIAAGVTYQTNYTARLKSSETCTDPYALYETLRERHRPPYSSFLDLGEKQIVSLSPELFFKTSGRRITTRPMKGTATRGRFPEEDKEARTALRASPKERAENVMIVDLLRNDLGRVAVPGTVRVPELFTLETYPTFHTLTSTVTAELSEDVGLSALFRALFPCGSVTGAPKVSTMRLIRELEPTPRGVYCGAVGFLKPGGDAAFSVPIRTIVLTRNGAEYGVGSGVTWDSRADDEYAELAVKATLVTDPRPDFSLLETLLWNGQTLVRLGRHLARLTTSATFFGFSLDEQVVRDGLLEHVHHHPGTPRRVRLLVSRGGEVRLESQPFTPTDGPLRVTLAKEPVSSRDTFLFHKTTRRDPYDARRRDAPDADDVLLWNERGELTEFTIGNVVLGLDGKLVTPPLEAGLLAGVMRAEGLEAGLLEERALNVEDLARATKIWRINSLRGWQEVGKIDLSNVTQNTGITAPVRR